MSADRIEDHTVITMTYTIRDPQGTVLEQVDLPVSYVHGGRNDLLPALQQALAGHQPGDTVEITLPPEEAFGDSDPALTYTDDIDNVPPEFRKLGAEVQMQNDSGEVKNFTVSRIEDGKLTVDGNHPLAGKTLTFALKVLEVRPATPQEVAEGVEQMQAPTVRH